MEPFTLPVFEIAWSGVGDGQTRVDVTTLNISVLNRVLANQAHDILTLQVVCDHDAGPLIPRESMVSVWRDDVRIFHGQARATQHNCTGELDIQIVPIWGPWGRLAGTAYWDDGRVGALNTNVPLPPSASGAFGRLKAWIETNAPTLMTMPTFASTGLSDVYWPSITGLSNQAFTANLQAIFATYPRVALAFDYTADPPAMQVRNGATEVDYARGTILQDWSLTTNDAKANGTAIMQRYDWNVLFTIGSGPGNIPTAVRDMIGDFVKSQPIQTYPDPLPTLLEVAMTFRSENGISFFTASAAEYIQSLVGADFWQGDMTLKDNCLSGLKPGDRVNITGSLAAWATMGATIQTVTENFAEGTTALSLGINRLLKAEDALEAFLNYMLRAPGVTDRTWPPSDTSIHDDPGDWPPEE